MNLKPTKEQQEIIEVVKSGESALINAKAGAAKTTTLTMIAKSYPKSALYLTFNKAMADEVKERFPDYVDVRTWHSLAFREFGAPLKHKLSRPRGAYQNVLSTGAEIARAFKLKNLVVGDKYLSAAALGLAVKNTLTKFEYSHDDSLSEKHVCFGVADKFKVKGNISKDFPVDIFIDVVLKGAEDLWRKRKDPSDPTIIAHDTYLKLFQLSRPCLDEYDVIYSDESQDSSDAMIDILKNQKGSQLVVVGDKHQQIYAFRGSVNAMSKFPHLRTYNLSKSFRFGCEVAELASDIVGEKVEGWEEVNTKIYKPNESVPLRGATIIYRTNMAMLFEACDLMSEGYSVNMENDVKRVGRLIQSALALRSGDKRLVRAEELSPYNTWEEFEDDCKNSRGELTQILNIIKSGRAFEVMGVASSYKKVDNPDIVMCTAHKSKGMEWDRVVLAEDFPEVEMNESGGVHLKEEEINLLYVAATRAKKELKINHLLNTLISVNKPRSSGLQVNVKGVYCINDSNSLNNLGEVFDKEVKDIEDSLTFDEIEQTASDGILPKFPIFMPDVA